MELDARPPTADEIAEAERIRDAKLSEDAAWESLACRFANAVNADDVALVGYMLDAGMHPNTRHPANSMDPLEDALVDGQLAMVKLLRRNGAKIRDVDAIEAERRWRADEDEKRKQSLASFGFPPGPYDDYEPRTRLPRACHRWLRSKPPQPERLTGVRPWRRGYLPAAWGARDARQHDEDTRKVYAKVIKHVARWQAAMRMLHRPTPAECWHLVRMHVKARGVAVYLQGCAHERACAPGGPGRAADLAAFEKACRVEQM